MANGVEVGILIKGAVTTIDVIKAMRAMANTMQQRGPSALNGEWEVGNMVIITRQR